MRVGRKISSFKKKKTKCQTRTCAVPIPSLKNLGCPGIKVGGQNVNNLRYVITDESKEELQ